MIRLLSIVLLFSAPAIADDQATIEQSRQLSMQLGKQLSTELMAAMKAQGPVHAIAVCNERAPAIAQNLSQTHGAEVSRTALKVRNTDNTPTAEQKAVLDYFQARLQKDPDSVPEVLFESSHGGQQYMRAIVMQPQCAACHGKAVKDEVRQAVIEKYPNDQAVGFDVGELRGSFVVHWLND